MNKLLTILKLAAVFIAGCNAMLLLLSVSAAYINPYNFWLPALLKLFFPLWFFTNLFFILVFYVLKNKKTALFFSVASLISFLSFSKIYSFNFKEESKSTAKNTYRVMTYNVMGFDWYVRKKKAYKVVHTIRDANPDLLLMQEYMMANKDAYKIKDSLTHKYGFKYFYESIVSVVSAHYYFGLAVFSKTPVFNPQNIDFENSASNGAFSIDTKIGKDTVRIFNVHFESFGLLKEEYSLPEEGKSFFNQIKLYRKSALKLRTGFRRKSIQLQNVLDAIKASPYKVIVCGDFNDTPLSYVYYQLTENLTDTYRATSFGAGSTYAGKLPFLRIDYILADKNFTPLRTMVLKRKASDHYPLICDFAIQ